MATLLVSIFIPKHLASIIRDLIRFTLISNAKKWYKTILMFIVLSMFMYFILRILHLGISCRFFVIPLSLSILIVAFQRFRKHIHKNYEPINIAFYGNYSIVTEGILKVDIDSDFINNHIKEEIKNVISNHFTYRNKLINIEFIELPKVFPILIGHLNFISYLKKKVEQETHLSSILFLRNISKQNISVKIIINDKSVKNSQVIKEAEESLNIVLNEGNLPIMNIVGISSKLYLLLMGQSLLQFLYLDKQYQSIHYILDDSEKLISKLTTELHTLSTEKSKYLFKYLNFWCGYIERYRAVTLIAQKQYGGAILHIFKSFQLNPYFPYSNYSNLKQDYSKRYGVDIIPGLNDIGEMLYNKFDSSVNINVSNQLKSQIEYDDIEFLYELLKDIILEAKSEELNKIIISELKMLDKTIPFNFLSYAEVIKFIKKGDSIFQQIYIERIDESISMLRNAIELDHDFPLIYTKIGVLLLIKGAHYKNDNFINEGMLEYEKGIYFMERLGIRQGSSGPQ